MRFIKKRFIEQVNTSIESLSKENTNIIQSVTEVKSISSKFKKSIPEIKNTIKDKLSM